MKYKATFITYVDHKTKSDPASKLKVTIVLPSTSKDSF